MAYSASASITIDAPKEKVWDALTKPELVKQYFFGTDLETTWERGGRITFSGSWEGKSYEDKGEVLSFNPMNSLSYTYLSSMSGKDDVPENYSTITYEVDDAWSGIKVTINSDADSQESAEHSAKNWEKVLEAMKKLIESEKE